MSTRVLVISLLTLATGVAVGRYLGGGEKTHTGATVNASATAGTAGTSSTTVTAQSVLGAFGNESPGIARVFTALHEADMEKSPSLYAALSALTPEEVEKVREALKRMPNHIASLLRPSLLEQWVRNNPAEAALKVREMPEGRFDDKEGIAAAWAEANPELALADAGRLGAQSAKAIFLRRAAIESLARTDPSLAMDYAEALQDGREKDDLMTTTASELARRRPEAASVWLASRLSHIKIGAEGSELVNSMLAAFAAKDPERAKAELGKLPDLLRRSGANAIGSEIIYYNPRAGLEWCAANGVFPGEPENENGQYYNGRSSRSGAFETAIQRDRESAVAWTLDQPAGEMRDFGLRRLIPGAKTTEELVRYFGMVSPDLQDDVAGAAVQVHARLAKLDETVAWIEKLPEHTRDNATLMLISAKAGTNAQELMPLVEKLPEGSLRDQGATQLFAYQSFTNSDSKNSEKLLAMISNPEMRQQAVMQTYSQMAYRNRNDIEKAHAWLDALPGVTAEQKASIKGSVRFR